MIRWLKQPVVIPMWLNILFWWFVVSAIVPDSWSFYHLVFE